MEYHKVSTVASSPTNHRTSCSVPTSDAGPLQANRLEQDIHETVIIMKNNADKVIQRGEKLDELELHADEVELFSRDFGKTSSQLKVGHCWANTKCNVYVIGLVVTACIAIIIIILLILKPWEDSNPTTQSP